LEDKLRLLLVSRTSPFEEITGPIAGGAEHALRSIAEQMASIGHDVHFMACSEHVQGDFLVNNVSVHLIPIGSAYFLLDTPLDKVLQSNLSYLGHLRFVPELFLKIERWFLRTVLGIYHWAFLEEVENLCRSREIQLIHCFSSLPDSLIASIVSSRTGIPVVLRMGGRFWFSRYSKFGKNTRRINYRSQLEYVFQTARCLAFNSRFMRDESNRLLNELSLDYTGQQTVVDIGAAFADSQVDTDEIEREICRLPGEIVICCIGKFKIGSKRQDLLISAAAELRHKQRLKIVFAGDGPEIDAMKELSSRLGLSSTVVFLGDIARDQVRALLEISDIFAHPSEYEGASKALAEAMSLGKPIIASSIPANAELIRHDCNGWLAENDVASFAQGINLLCSSKSKMTQLGRSAKESAYSTLRPENNVAKYQTLFRGILGQGS